MEMDPTYKVSMITCYGTQLISGLKIKELPWKTLFYTKISMATTMATEGSILKLENKHLNFNRVCSQLTIPVNHSVGYFNQVFFAVTRAGIIS